MQLLENIRSDHGIVGRIRLLGVRELFDLPITQPHFGAFVQSFAQNGFGEML